MTISELLNSVSCGAGDILGTGTKGCRPFLKKVVSLWLVPQGFKFDGAETLGQTYIQQLQAEGNLIVLKGIRTFTPNTSEDNIDELEDKTKQVAALGKYEFACEFLNGMYFHAALHSLNSYGNYDVVFVDRENNILGTKATDGSLKGFTLGMLQAQPLMFASDTQGQREGLVFQMTERLEMDSDYIFVDYKNLDGFKANALDGVNEVELSFSVAPADAATSLTIKAVTKQDGKAFTGIDYEDFLVTVDGATANPTAGDDSVTTGTFVLTVAALATNEVVTVRLYDNVNSRVGVVVDSSVYKSKVITATVV